MNIYFDADELNEACDGETNALLRSEPMLDVRRPTMKVWVNALEQAMTHFGCLADDAAVCLARRMLAELAGSSSGPSPRLSPCALKLMREHVAARSSQSIRVAELAAEVGMTPGRLSTAFKATTGLPPHRFVLEQRLEHARRLLLETRLALAEIAMVCGFASQQHMTTTLSRIHGTTPAQLRRRALPS